MASIYETGAMKIYLDETGVPRFSSEGVANFRSAPLRQLTCSAVGSRSAGPCPVSETADPQFFAGTLAYSSGVLASQLALRLNCSSIEGSQRCLTHPGSGDAAQPVRTNNSVSWKISRTNIFIVYSTFPAAESCPYLHRGPKMSTLPALAASARA